MQAVRHFTSASKFYTVNGMITSKTQDELFEQSRAREELYERYLKNRETDPNGFQEHALKYFRELNRNRDYLAVKRIYEKYHMDPRYPNSKKVDKHYNFAIDNLRALQKAALKIAQYDIMQYLTFILGNLRIHQDI